MINPTLASVVAQQLPEFIRDDYPTFVKFLEAYSEWLDSNSIDLKSVRDITTTVDQYIKYLIDEVAPGTYSSSMDGGSNFDRLVLERSNAQYLAKGSEASYQLLFQILFKKRVQIKYPATQILRASDGRWKQDTSIFVQVVTGDPNAIIGKIVDVVTPSTILKVLVTSQQPVSIEIDNIVKVSDDIYELMIDRSYYGIISVGDRIRYSDQFDSIVQPTTSSVSVVNAGSGFTPGDMFDVKSGAGTGSTVKVISTLPGGGIRAIQFVRYGIGYEKDFAIPVSVNKKSTSSVPLLIDFSNDQVQSVEVTDGGSGYTVAPTASFSGLSTISAVAGTVHISGGAVVSVDVINPGRGYSTPPTIAFSGGDGTGAAASALLGNDTGLTVQEDINISRDSGYINKFDYCTDGATPWTRGTTYSIGTEIYYSDNVYSVTASGSSTQPPTHTSGSETYGTLTLLWKRKYAAAFDGTYSGEVLRTFNNSMSDSSVLDDSAAILSIKLGSVARYPGYYTSNNGFLDESIKLQDSFYYQAFSYVIQVDELLSSYASAVKALVQPAGLKLFGEYNVGTQVSLNLTLKSIVKILALNANNSTNVSEFIALAFSTAFSDGIGSSDWVQFALTHIMADAFNHPTDSINTKAVTKALSDAWSTFGDSINTIATDKVLQDNGNLPTDSINYLNSILSKVDNTLPTDSINTIETVKPISESFGTFSDAINSIGTVHVESDSVGKTDSINTIFSSLSKIDSIILPSDQVNSIFSGLAKTDNTSPSDVINSIQTGTKLSDLYSGYSDAIGSIDTTHIEVDSTSPSDFLDSISSTSGKVDAIGLPSDSLNSIATVKPLADSRPLPTDSLNSIGTVKPLADSRPLPTDTISNKGTGKEFSDAQALPYDLVYSAYSSGKSDAVSLPVDASKLATARQSSDAVSLPTDAGGLVVSAYVSADYWNDYANVRISF